MFRHLKLIRLKFFGAVLSGLVFSSLVFPEPLTAASKPDAIPALGGILARDNLWPAYRNRFITDEGRVVDTGNGSISHSEGQGYAMLLAVAAGDRAGFDKIWSWTRNNLYIGRDEFAAWKWSPQTGRVEDRNNATDGDILIAWALAEAASYWKDVSYGHAAMSQTRRIRNRLIYKDHRYGYLIKPGVFGFSSRDRRDGPVVNLSYWVFPAFERFAKIDPEFDWDKVTQSGIRLIREAGFGVSGLPVEWTSIGGLHPQPAAGFSATFGYNAVRIPLYLAWSNRAGRGALPPFVQAWRTATVRRTAHNRLLAEFKKMVNVEPGYAAIFDLAACVTFNNPPRRYFYRIKSNYHYYSSTLHALSVLAAAVVKPSCIAEHRRHAILDPAWKRRDFSAYTHEYSPLLVSATQSKNKPNVPVFSVVEKQELRSSAKKEDSTHLTRVLHSQIAHQERAFSKIKSSLAGITAFLLLGLRMRRIVTRRRSNTKNE